MTDYQTAAGVVLAGGSGSRLGAADNKVYLPLAGRPILAWSLRAFAAAGVGRLVLVVRPVDRALAEQTVTRHVPCPVDLVEGGPSRHDSEYNALVHLAPRIRDGECDVVAVHDGARPLVQPELVQASIDAARGYGAAVPGISVDDVAAVASTTTPPLLSTVLPDTATRGRLVRVQTPQAFQARPLLDSYEQAAADGFTGTDTSACVERYAGLRVHHFPGDVRNLKVTYRHDLAVAEALARNLR